MAKYYGNNCALCYVTLNSFIKNLTIFMIQMLSKYEVIQW